MLLISNVRPLRIFGVLVVYLGLRLEAVVAIATVGNFCYGAQGDIRPRHVPHLI